MTKPFEMDELIAHIISLIYRYICFNHSEGMSEEIEFDGLTIDPDSRSVISVNGIFELLPKEFDILLLARR